MPSVSLSLPDALRDWIDARVRAGDIEDAETYVLDLIRRDQERVRKIAAMQKLVDEAYASGISDRTPREILEDARARHFAAVENGGR